MAYTTTTLLDAIAKIAAVPVAQNTFDNQDILDIASQCVETEILPKVLQSRQEFYVVSEIITPALQAGDVYASYRIPSRAVGQTIVGAYDVAQDEMIDPTYYWVEGSRIYFDSDAPNSVRIRYYLRPGKLVETSAAAVVKAIDRVTGVIEITAAPPSTMTTGVAVDFIRYRAGFDTLKADAAIVSTYTSSPYTITFAAADIPAELAVGDYIAIADESPVPQVPVEWIPYLGYWTAHAMLETLGDSEAAAQILKRIPRMEQNALSLISPRIVNKSKPILRPRNYYWRY